MGQTQRTRAVAASARTVLHHRGDRGDEGWTCPVVGGAGNAPRSQSASSRELRRIHPFALLGVLGGLARIDGVAARDSRRGINLPMEIRARP